MSEANDLAKKHNKKAALGRGLGSLLGEKPASMALNEKVAPPIVIEDKALNEGFVEKKLNDKALINDHSRIWQIDISQIKPNKKQPRRIFDGETLAELTNSIKEKGILQPIVARSIGNNEFEIIAGERRWRAAQHAGLKEVPVILKASPDQEALELALIENIQRENLNPIEEAEACHYLITQYKLTQQQLADKLGKDRATIANLVRLLGLHKDVRQMLADDQITLGHAKVLLALSDQAQQRSFAQKVAEKKISVRELERQIAKALTPNMGTEASSPMSMDISEKFMAGLSEELQKLIGTKIAIEYNKGKGKISISFFSDDQLNSIVDKVRSAWQR